MRVEGPPGPAVAFAEGAMSFFSPCVLPLVPVYLAQVPAPSQGRESR
jgi:cytochrome c biogenesis protein CcdA